VLSGVDQIKLLPLDDREASRVETISHLPEKRRE
jgi:hypothetical protein